jgi:hypothetical protein
MPPIEYDGPVFDVFGNILKMIRVFAILCAIVFAGAGGTLAWHFFFFVKDIVQEPGPVVEQWQTAMAPKQQERFVPETPPVSPTPAVPVVQPAPASPEAPAVPVDPAPPEAVTVPVVPEPIDEAPVPFTPTHNDDAELFLNFASSVLDRFEAGHFSWLVGMCFLAVFCWILGKVPGVMISVGAKVLVELLNYEKPKPRGPLGI